MKIMYLKEYSYLKTNQLMAQLIKDCVCVGGGEADILKDG